MMLEKEDDSRSLGQAKSDKNRFVNVDSDITNDNQIFTIAIEQFVNHK